MEEQSEVVLFPTSLSFENKAKRIIGDEHVLGRELFKALEDLYNLKHQLERKTLKFDFSDDKPSLTDKQLEEIVADKDNKYDLVEIPRSITIQTKEETLQGERTLEEIKKITLGELSRLFPEYFERDSKIQKYQDEEIPGGWFIQDSKGSIETVAKYEGAKILGKTLSCPSPAYLYLTFLRDFLNKKENGPFNNKPQITSDDNVDHLLASVNSGLTVDVVGGSALSQRKIEYPKFFFTQPANSLLNGKVIGIFKIG